VVWAPVRCTGSHSILQKSIYSTEFWSQLKSKFKFWEGHAVARLWLLQSTDTAAMAWKPTMVRVCAVVAALGITSGAPTSVTISNTVPRRDVQGNLMVSKQWCTTWCQIAAHTTHSRLSAGVAAQQPWFSRRQRDAVHLARLANTHIISHLNDLLHIPQSLQAEHTQSTLVSADVGWPHRMFTTAT
jgi:hypothetical protein